MTYLGLMISTEEKEIVELNKKDVKGLSKLPGYPFDDRYVASRDGNVYKVKYRRGNRIYAYGMKPFTTYDGYIEYVLTTIHGTKKHIQGQRIIAGLFIKPVRGKSYVNHKSGDRTDNSVDNLEWVTHAENIRHSYKYLRPKRVKSQ